MHVIMRARVGGGYQPLTKDSDPYELIYTLAMIRKKNVFFFFNVSVYVMFV